MKVSLSRRFWEKCPAGQKTICRICKAPIESWVATPRLRDDESGEHSYYYLFKSCFLAQISDRQRRKSLKHQYLVLTRSHKATELGGHFCIDLLRVFVPLCESIFGCGRRPRWAIRVIRGSKKPPKQRITPITRILVPFVVSEKRWRAAVKLAYWASRRCPNWHLGAVCGHNTQASGGILNFYKCLRIRCLSAIVSIRGGGTGCLVCVLLDSYHLCVNC
jgi:hypothetical protein